MLLQKIDKARYRKHLNIVILASIIGLAGISLSISQLLIALYPDESGSHFHWNLLGVIVACVVVGLSLKQVKNHSFMAEVYYIWQLKQVLNQIQRKQTKLKPAIEANDVSAMIIQHYYYQACRHLWLLDDNTITLDDLGIRQAALDSQAQTLNLELNTDDFSLDMLAKY